MDVILKVDSILKQFRKITAVNHLSFVVQRGEIFALLGPNGAGKTTTVRMLMNILRPDEGTIEFFLNENNSPIAFSSQVGYLPEERGLYQEISIIKILIYMGIIRGMSRNDAQKSSDEWLAKLELLDRKNDKLTTLSKGNQQKIQFISAVLHNPTFVILDEPFAGFDPINQEAFLTIIKELRDKGSTVLLSSHQMHLVEKIADKVLLINKGKKIASGTVEEIKKESSISEKLIFTFEGEYDFSFLQNDDAVEKYEILKEREIKIFLRQNKSISSFLNKISSNIKITSVKTEHTSLHDIFIDRISQDLEGNDEKL